MKQQLCSFAVLRGDNRMTGIDKINLKDYLFEEIEKLFNDWGLEKYRAKQVFKWLYRSVKDFDEMTNLSNALKNTLKEKCLISFPEILEKQESSTDGTVKYLLKLIDGNIIESVLMKYKHGNTICISTQAGCKMGCKFCASTIGGLVRNLTPGEILDQVLFIQKDFGERISNIVIMGIGEPFDNYDNVIKFLRNVNHKEGVNIGYRHISVSTCGLVPEILKLADEGMPVTLSISLHAPNDTIREKIMPVNKRYPISALIDACKVYIKKTGRRITFEYALIMGINDSVENSAQLSSKIRHMLCHVNLIPVNEVGETPLRRATENQIKLFKNRLEQDGVTVTVRRELGSDIDAACGQLRRRYM